jgi:hypothetical protein
MEDASAGDDPWKSAARATDISIRFESIADLISMMENMTR